MGREGRDTTATAAVFGGGVVGCTYFPGVTEVVGACSKAFVDWWLICLFSRQTLFACLLLLIVLVVVLFFVFVFLSLVGVVRVVTASLSLSVFLGMMIIG